MCEAFEMNQNLGISAKAKFVDFHLLGCSLVKFCPDVKFLGSTDSCDPEDFKNSLKKAKQVHRKAAQKVNFFPLFYRLYFTLPFLPLWRRVRHQAV